MSKPLPQLRNLGNTCWCAALIQALRAVGPVFHHQFEPHTLLARAMRDDTLDDMMLRQLYEKSRRVLKAPDMTPEDPAEFLLALLDLEKVNSKCFESSRVIVKCCEMCGHTRMERINECTVIIPSIPNTPKPLQRALDVEFGYRVPEIISNKRESAESARDRLGLENNATTRLGGVPGERWWSCDDDLVKDVALTSAAPYLLFYVERMPEGYRFDDNKDTTFSDAIDLDQDTIASLLPTVHQTQRLDCEGKCKGRKTKHSVFVGSYETSHVLVVHVQRPRLTPLSHVERTLFASEEEVNDNSVPFDLVAMVCRVGMSHYVCYRRKFTT